MGTQAANDIVKQLDANESELGFVEYLPDEVQDDLNRAIGQYLSQSKSQLDQAVTQGVTALPLFLRSVVRGLFK